MVVQSVSDFLEMLMNQVEESKVRLKVPSPEEFNQLVRQKNIVTVISPDTSLTIDQALSPRHSIWPDFLKTPHLIQLSNKATFLDWLLLYLDRFQKSLEGSNKTISQIGIFYDRLVGLSADFIRQQQKQAGEVLKKMDDCLLGREVKALLQSVRSVVE